MDLPEGYEEVSPLPEGYEEVNAEGPKGPSYLDHASAMAEAGRNVFTGAAAMGGAMIGTGLHDVNELVHGRLPGADTYDILNKKFTEMLSGQTLDPKIRPKTTSLGEDYTDEASKFMNYWLNPLLGHSTSLHYEPGAKAPKEIPKTPRQAALDAIDAAKKTAIPEGYEEVKGPIPNEAQAELPDAAMAIAPQYGIHEGMGRIDENGMPIRADLSMDVQNVQNPLQRNLWGDELPGRTGDGGLPITRAIDKMPDLPWKSERDEAIGQLSHELPADEALTKATERASEEGPTMELPSKPTSGEGSPVIPKGQRGGLNMDIFDPAFNKIKDLADGARLVLFGGPEGPIITAFGKNGEQLGKLELFHNTMKEPKASDSLYGGWVESKGGYAKEMYKFASELGNDIKASNVQTEAGKAMWDRFEKQGLSKDRVIPKGQRGGIDLDSIFDGFAKLRAPKRGAIEDYLTKTVPGMKESYDKSLTRPDSPEKIIKDTLAHGEDTSNLWDSVQSGPLLTSAKFDDHPLLLGVGRWLQYSAKKTEYQFRQIVQPLEKMYSSLSGQSMIELADVLKREMVEGKQYTPEELKSAGFSPKQIDTYNMQRKAFNDVWELQNETNKTLGKPAITKLDAYMSSTWYGDWHVPIQTKDGKLAWYIRTTTRGEAKKAINYLKENFPELAIDDSTKADYRPNTMNPNVPRDVMGAYSDMLGYFADQPEISSQIKQAMEQYAQDRSYGALGQSKHFLHKEGIRGFEGDRPWKSDKDNAYALISAQTSYLKNANRWANMQEAMANIKQVMSDPNISAKMPNAMDYIKQVVANEYGIMPNLMKGLEEGLAELLGTSRSSLYRGTQNMKTMTYLQMLGASPAYMIATPLQTLMNTPSWHRILTNQGFEHNVAKTTLAAMGDFFAGMANHYGEEMVGKSANLPMTKVGKEALKYAEDNGIVSKTLFDEYSGLGSSQALQTVKNTLGATISLPEKAARLSAFMGFVHHMEQSGKYADRLDMFRRAQEMTDMAITDFRSSERPMIVDKFGAGGQMAYTFKSFLFNQYNQLSVFSRQAAKGSPLPLLAAGGMMALLGGIQDLPGAQEMDGFWNLFKDVVASKKPEYYNLVKGPGLKGTIVGKLPDWAAYGLVSKAMGAQMSSRFSPGVIDPEKPLQGVAPVVQEAKEWAGIGNAAVNPTSTNVAEGIYQNMPSAIKGNMETHMDVFKGPKQGDKQMYLNPNDLLSQRGQYPRTQSDETYRKFGMYSLPEAKTKTLDYIARSETGRVEDAKKNLIDKTFDAVRRGDKDDLRQYATAYLKLNPDSSAFQSAINQKIDQFAFTPEQRNILKANTIAEVLRLQRRLSMESSSRTTHDR